MKISFIGGGNMASALIGGLLKPGQFDQDKAPIAIHVIDPDQATRQRLQQQFKLSVAAQINAEVEHSDVVLLAVKPQQMKTVVAQLLPYLKTQLVLSIAAGIRAVDLSRWLNGHRAIVRSMPNTPALIGMGMTGLVALPEVSPKQRALGEAVMRSVGEVLWLQDERLLDAVTAVSGSGPAYVFYFMEALQEAGQQLGLSAAQSRQLALSTFVGSAQLAFQSSESIATLRERVTSKGGTTHAALESMQQDDVKASIQRAVQAAATRAAKIGLEFE